MCLAALLLEQFLPIHKWRCQDFNQVLLYGAAFSSSEVLGKRAPCRVNCRLQLAGLRR